MASNLDRERLLARMEMNLVFTRVLGIFRYRPFFPATRRFQPLKGLENV
jgi:hypothetical protein